MKECNKISVCQINTQEIGSVLFTNNKLEITLELESIFFSVVKHCKMFWEKNNKKYTKPSWEK